jgi:hypothetical protein
VRKALNENPIVQVVMLGALGIVVAFLFMTRVMGQEESGGSATSADATAPAPAAPVVPEATSSAEVPATPEAGAVPGTATAPAAGEFEAGAGLPESVVSAHEAGDVVVLLVVNRKAPEDRRLEAEVNALRGRGDTSVFVAEAKDVARYSRIAEGVDLDRVPALVVVEPKRQVEGPLPVATVSYGYRGPESVQQAVRDVLYDGKELSFAPS